jgi:hypothetical protein
MNVRMRRAGAVVEHTALPTSSLFYDDEDPQGRSM